MTLKSLYVSAENGRESEEDFWKTFNGDDANENGDENKDNDKDDDDDNDENDSYDDEEDEEEETELKEIVMNFNDIEKR
jgi:hypothetical protein